MNNPEVADSVTRLEFHKYCVFYSPYKGGRSFRDCFESISDSGTSFLLNISHSRVSECFIRACITSAFHKSKLKLAASVRISLIHIVCKVKYVCTRMFLMLSR